LFLPAPTPGWVGRSYSAPGQWGMVPRNGGSPGIRSHESIRVDNLEARIPVLGESNSSRELSQGRVVKNHGVLAFVHIRSTRHLAGYPRSLEPLEETTWGNQSAPLPQKW
jgi:hypothetical protein